MDNHYLIAEFKNRSDFQTAIEVLEKAHFNQEEVSTVVHADDESLAGLNATTVKSAASPSRQETAATTTLVGGTLGAALGTMTMMGPMLVAGPLFGVAAGVVGGSVLGAVESWGVDRDVAGDYEAKVRDGALLIIVSGDLNRVSVASRLLKTAGPASLGTFPL
ncbi:DUF1269 domain-containing protein [Rubripirellula reticaptiva]|uniref:DUF1269 domain-containing protein n=1 Tax=Rubripirellula reticaptiva TaxID=2528013 RepID=A0A5C6ERL5_9BACT|nr:DUF1269 domain-containing protein [Rubripirellula reticaptiva]TWU51265.1 hypothetical protein Poly59_28570 [Rubripirellula reticaptiva]